MEQFLYMPVLEALKFQKWRVGSPTVVTCIHRLSSPPWNESVYTNPISEAPPARLDLNQGGGAHTA